nr:helix-turn-helix transcriptional regulator [uncultured Faecalibacillus sp.]
MKYNYNKLWKLLIDKKITKTELRLRTGISTNMLAKMGKNESVTMETIAKIATYLRCGIDDIIEIQEEGVDNGWK